MNRIVWLASYPKSGNTWFRIFLANYLRNQTSAIQLKELSSDNIAFSRDTFEKTIGYDSGEMTFEEIDHLRPEVYLTISRQSTELCFCKVHDAYSFLPDGRPLFPPEATNRVIYFIRNPLDVTISYAHHIGAGNFDQAISRLNNNDHSISGSKSKANRQLRQKLLTWSGHVHSWLTAPGMKVCPLRYEDMNQHPRQTFTKAIRFLGLPDDQERIDRAIRFSTFSTLQNQEKKQGFAEKHPSSKAFFREGRTETWRGQLSTMQIDRIINSHHGMMTQFGYLDSYGSPID